MSIGQPEPPRSQTRMDNYHHCEWWMMLKTRYAKNSPVRSTSQPSRPEKDEVESRKDVERDIAANPNQTTT